MEEPFLYYIGPSMASTGLYTVEPLSRFCWAVCIHNYTTGDTFNQHHFGHNFTPGFLVHHNI